MTSCPGSRNRLGYKTTSLDALAFTPQVQIPLFTNHPATMPRNGDGSSHNGPFDEARQEIAHGVGHADVRRLTPDMASSMLTPSPQTEKVARADKTAPVPEPEKGRAVEGLDASGGQSQGIKRGPHVGQGGSGSSN